MERDRRAASVLELTLLGAVAAEALVGRLIARGLDPHPAVGKTIVSPGWKVALDNVALFLLYFAALVGVAALAVRVLELVRRPTASRADRIDAVVGAVTLGVLAAAAVYAVITVSPGPRRGERGAYELVLHGALAAVAAHQIVRAWVGRAELWSAIGFTVCALPIVLYGGAAIFSHALWDEDQLMGGQVKEEMARWVLGGLSIAAISSAYLLSPRPFVRHATRLLPFIVAVLTATLGATMLRMDYVQTVHAAGRVFGLELRTDADQNQVALYLLAFATAVWTVVSCVTGDAPARRRIGIGLALMILLGHSFAWPLAFVAGAVGLTMMADGALAVRGQEHATFAPATPPIDDEAWQGYVSQVVAGLRRGAAAPVSAVSVRGEGHNSSTVIVTERHGVPVRVRVERVARSVVVLDLVCGREVDLGRHPTWTAQARSSGPIARGNHPEPPAAGAPFRSDDAAFDERFRSRGDRATMMGMFDDALRARAAAGLDGWIAFWQGEGLRHRVYPGVGAPVDAPLPLSDLAVRRSASPHAAERLVAVVELCSELAARGLPAVDEPAALATAPGAELADAAES